MPYHLLYLKPDRGIPQGVDVGVSSACDFSNQETHTYSGMYGIADSIYYSDDGPFSRCHDSEFDQVSDVMEVEGFEFTDVEGFAGDMFKQITDEVPYIRGEA